MTHRRAHPRATLRTRYDTARDRADEDRRSWHHYQQARYDLGVVLAELGDAAVADDLGQMARPAETIGICADCCSTY